MKNKLLVFCLTCFVSTAWSQVIVSPGSILSIQPGVTFFTSGDFTNNGQVLNNGSLIISGAWTNTGDYQAESGQVTFNGSGQQVINHNAQAFASLVISGGGQKVFDADISVQQELNLQNGILLTNNGSKIVLDAAATVTGGSSTSFVQGALYTKGTGSRFFPVGYNGVYLPVTLTNIAGTGVVGVLALEPNPNSVVGAGLLSVSPKHHWEIKTLSGTFNGSPVVLPLVNEDFTSTDHLVVAAAPNAEEAFQSLGRQSVTGIPLSGSVTSTSPATQTLYFLTVGEENTNKEITVYNAVTPGNDGKHDFLKIVNIEFYPANAVTIINRWGDKVFELSGYNNDDRVFNGEGNVGGTKALSDGTYYYVIDKRNGEKKLSGFFILRR